MIFIITDENRVDTAEMDGRYTLDFEIGKGAKNDFTVSIPMKAWSECQIAEGGYIYAQGTEYGGEVMTLTSNNGSPTFTCDTWRLLLDKKAIQYPEDADYLTLEGDLKDTLRMLLGGRLGTLFEVREGLSGVVVSGYQVDRVTTMLEAMEKVCTSHGHNLTIEADGYGDVLKVYLDAVPIKDYSDQVEVSQDMKLSFKVTRTKPAYTHMVCYGSGELQDRVKVLLDWNNGNPVEISTIPDGERIKEYIYDYPSAESREALITDGIKKFEEINSVSKNEVSSAKEEDVYCIGDIVGGRDYVTGIHVAAPITSKVIKVSRRVARISYKIGE